MESKFEVSKNDKPEQKTAKFGMNFMSLSRHTKPIYVEGYNQNHPWMKWGDDNLLPNYYVDIYRNSPTNGQAINAKSRFTAGQGFVLGDEPFLNYINEDDENANDILTKVALDLNLLSSFALNIIWSNDRKKIASISHIDISLLRSGKCDIKGKINSYWFSNDWSLMGQRKPQNKPVEIKCFNATDRTEANQILVFKKQRPGCLYYTWPEYEGGVDSIEEEIECINFHLMNVKNGFSPSFSINFNNVPAPEEMDAIYRDFQKKYKGTDNVGKVVMTFSEPGNAPQITPLQSNDSDKKYEKQQENARQNILISHSITSPMMFGILQPGQLGGRKEMVEAFEIFQNVVISEQQKILERHFNKLFKLAGIVEFKEIIPFKIINPIDLSITENKLLEVLSRDEVRNMLGLKNEVPDSNVQNPLDEIAAPIEDVIPSTEAPVQSSKEVPVSELKRMIVKQLNS